MKLKVPEPLQIPWLCKSVDSAASGVEILDDRRVRCRIEHEPLKGVTPAMLVWWFKNLEGTIAIDGVEYDRYRVWHPRDHVFARYAKRGPNGEVGVGSVIHLAETLGADARYLIHIKTLITKLDESGYVHRPRVNGLPLAVMDYEFEQSGDATLYRNSLTFGVAGAFGRILNPLLRRLFFDDAHATAWIKHNVEEVGNFEWFLPRLYAENVSEPRRESKNRVRIPLMV